MPYRSKYRTSSVRARLLITSICAIFGLTLSTNAILMSPYVFQAADDIHRSMKAIFPFILFASVSIILCILLNAYTMGSQIKKIEKFVSNLSEHDFTSKPMRIVCRNEFGSLMTHINNLQEVTRNLLREFITEVDISTGKKYNGRFAIFFSYLAQLFLYRLHSL